LELALRIPLGAQREMDIEKDVSLAPFTTFGIGGPAVYMVRAKTFADVQAAFAFAKEQKLKVLILGGGSNMLVADEGFDGLVVKIELQGITREGDLLVAAAGEPWDGLVERAVREGLWGIENLSGIPGTMGAAPIQNIGAYGTEVKDTLAWVEVLEVTSGAVRRFSNAECQFGYRDSYFKRNPREYVVLRVAFALREEAKPNITYKDLQTAFSGKDIERVDLSRVREAVLGIRAKKFPDLSLEGTAGSYFLNPIVAPEVAARLAARYPELPQFSTANGVKVSLAWLLDHALGLKGIAVGGARLFERQPIVVVAVHGTRATDVRALAQKIKDEVKEKVSVDIEEEVQQIF
jgi:UDP-N-acetylmuramate dehydrogenase